MSFQWRHSPNLFFSRVFPFRRGDGTMFKFGDMVRVSASVCRPSKEPLSIGTIFENAEYISRTCEIFLWQLSISYRKRGSAESSLLTLERYRRNSRRKIFSLNRGNEGEVRKSKWPQIGHYSRISAPRTLSSLTESYTLKMTSTIYCPRVEV